MQNQNAAIMRKLSDPDFQASLVNRSLGLVTGLSVLLGAFVIHDAWIWTHPPTPKYFIVDGKSAPRAMTAVDSPIVNDAELLDWTVKAVLAPYNVNYHDYPLELNTAGRRFTTNGWSTFAGSYIKSGNFEAMKKGMLLCFAQAQRSAVIVDSKIVGGALAYRVQGSYRSDLPKYERGEYAEDDVDGACGAYKRRGPSGRTANRATRRGGAVI